MPASRAITQEVQRSREHRDDQRVGAPAGRCFQRQDTRSDEADRTEKADLPATKPSLGGRHGPGDLAHRGVQRGGSEAEVADDPARVDRAAHRPDPVQLHPAVADVRD